MASNPYAPGTLPATLEDAFVKVSFEEIDNKADDAMSDPILGSWTKNSAGQRVGTEEFFAALFKKKYPLHHMVMTQQPLNILGLPMAEVEPVNPDEMITMAIFIPLARSQRVPGVVLDAVRFGAFNVQWEGDDFVVYVIRWTEGYMQKTLQVVLHASSAEPARQLLLTAGIWSTQLHDEILVFTGNYWENSRELWQEIQKADWRDVILSKDKKDTMHKDIYGFFAAEKVYKDLAIPWKRGLIMHGPPGNGKTISIKAIMKECDGKGFAPLYVKSFKSWAGEEYAIQQVFQKARDMSPCVLIFEDIDSLITPQNRSFFLNALDGLYGNEGLLTIATTNHLDQLDPALSERPSRFDRKYLFDDPDQAERKLYTRYWQHKLKSNTSVSFPDQLVDDVAGATGGFSFALLKEAFVSTLFLLATQDEGDNLEFESLLKKTVKDLASTIKKGRPSAAHQAAGYRATLPHAAASAPFESFDESKREELEARGTAQAESRDLRSMALAAARIGRRFI